jgi:hypothetical protein
MPAIKLQVINSIKPINSGEQKKLFMEGKVSNPLFKYKRYDFKSTIEKIKEIRKEIKTQEKNHIIKQLYLEKIEQFYHKAKMISLIGTDRKEFLDASKILYGDINTSDYKKILKNFDPEKIKNNKGKLNSQTIEKEFNKKLKEYSLSDWKTKVSFKRHSVAVSVNYFNSSGKPYKRVFIPDHYMVSRFRLKQLVRHEIETHILRQQNGRMQNLGILRRPYGTANELYTEEGLATYNALIKKKNNAIGSEVYGIIALGIVGKGMCFRQVYEKLLKLGFDEDLAWARTLRVFRGVSDTSKKGVYSTTDNIYYSSLQKVKYAFQKNPSIYKKLYLG